jgi:hypothetical protein
MRFVLIMITAVVLVTAAACGSGTPADRSTTALPQGGEPVRLDPALFASEITNPYPGNRWVYRESDGQGPEKRVEVVVLHRTEMILGIEAAVVHDVVTQGGALVEDTYDWYAQDAQGNVWYLGEDTKEYENGKVVSTEGSWKAGVDGAQPGIIMPAEPQPGTAFRQEYYAGEAEDRARILSVRERAEVPFGAFGSVVMTKDTTPLKPSILEYKFYAKGVGPVLVLGVSGGSSREELVRFERA